MAQAKFRPILTATSGLNNALDPTRLSFDFKTGVTELSQAVNVDVDNSGRVNRRRGRTAPKVALAARCGFADGEDCLFVSGSTLYKLKTNYAYTALRTDLTAGARMRYRRIANRIYYLNGTEKGYVYKDTDNTWSKGPYTEPGDSRRVLSNPPNGHLVSWFGGRALVAVDNGVFASEPSFYGVFDLHGSVKMMPTRVTMLQPTRQGLWVGTASQIMFYRGQKWKELRRELKADYGVLEGSDAVAPPEKLEASGQSIIFTTPEGICAGHEDGTLVNLTYKKLIFPTGRYASGAVVGDRYLVFIEP